PGRHQVGRRRIEFELAVAQEQRERQPHNRRLGQGGGAVFLLRAVAGRVPLVNDLVVAEHQERARLALRQLVLERVELLPGQALVSGGARREVTADGWRVGGRLGLCLGVVFAARRRGRYRRQGAGDEQQRSGKVVDESHDGLGPPWNAVTSTRCI